MIAAGRPGEARRLRILFALPGLHRVRRGAEVAFETLATELAALGMDVTLIGTGRDDPARPYRFEPVRCVPRERFEWIPAAPLMRSSCVYEELTYVPGLLRAFSPGDYDITCACSYPFTNWALRLPRPGRASPAHVFITQNGDWPAYARHREYRFFGCDGLVCTNPEYYERNKARWRCALIPNGVDDALFTPGPADRARFGLPEGAPVALVVSALIPSKRVVEGIHAAARVPGLHLVVAGEGELRAEVDACGRDAMGPRFRRITVPLAHADMPELYRAADVLLHMSQHEPFGIAYVEALAAGLPVVAHESAATRWTFEDQGFLVDTSDPAAVAGAIERALAARTPVHVAARRALVQRRFTWHGVAREYARFFGEVLRARGGAGPATADDREGRRVAP
jgi:glycosyltransferase involved in cell wall biosynthesis